MATTAAMPAHQVVKSEDHHDENLEQVGRVDRIGRKSFP